MRLSCDHLDCGFVRAVIHAICKMRQSVISEYYADGQSKGPKSSFTGGSVTVGGATEDHVVAASENLVSTQGTASGTPSGSVRADSE